MIENELNEIVSKIRKIFRYNLQLKEILKINPSVRLKNNGNDYEIQSIYFEDEDTANILFALPNGISLYESRSPKENPYTRLVEYDNYDALLAME